MDHLDKLIEEAALSVEHTTFTAEVTKLGKNRLKARYTGQTRCLSKKFIISRRTFRRIMNTLGTNIGYAERTTEARAKAVASKWNTIAYAVAQSIMVPKTVSELIMNANATSVNVGKNIYDKTKVVYKGKSTTKVHLKVAKKSKGSGGMAYFIKPHSTINATGDLGDLVIIVADDKMPKHALDYFGLEAGQRGHLVFSKTRVPDKVFIKTIDPKFWCPL